MSYNSNQDAYFYTSLAKEVHGKLFDFILDDVEAILPIRDSKEKIEFVAEISVLHNIIEDEACTYTEQWLAKFGTGESYSKARRVILRALGYRSPNQAIGLFDGTYNNLNLLFCNKSLGLEDNWLYELVTEQRKNLLDYFYLLYVPIVKGYREASEVKEENFFSWLIPHALILSSQYTVDTRTLKRTVYMIREFTNIHSTVAHNLIAVIMGYPTWSVLIQENDPHYVENRFKPLTV